ncbi:MAG: SBBP repeat-containing protein, partial [candidate division WOR-3 bacterium]
MRRVSNDFAICIRHSVWRTQSAMSFSHSTFHNPKSEIKNLFSIFSLTSDFCLLPSILLTFHLLLSTSHLFAQTPEWVYQYVNPNFSEVPYAITVDSFGNSYTTGYVGLGNNGGVGII